MTDIICSAYSVNSHGINFHAVKALAYTISVANARKLNKRPDGDLFTPYLSPTLPSYPLFPI